MLLPLKYHSRRATGAMAVLYLSFCVCHHSSLNSHSKKRSPIFSCTWCLPFSAPKKNICCESHSPYQFNQPISHLENGERDFHSGTNADFIYAFFTLENSNTSQNHRCEITQKMYSDLYISNL